MQGQEDLGSLPNQPRALNSSESSLTFLMLLQNTSGADNSYSSCLSKAQTIVLLILSKRNHLSLDAFRIMVLEMREPDRCQQWLKRKFKKHTFIQNKGSGSQSEANFFPHRSQRGQRKLYWKKEFSYPPLTRYIQFKKRCKVAQRLF